MLSRDDNPMTFHPPGSTDPGAERADRANRRTGAMAGRPTTFESLDDLIEAT